MEKGLQYLVTPFNKLDSNLAVLYSIVCEGDHSKGA